jgi:hypothetical protein
MPLKLIAKVPLQKPVLRFRFNPFRNYLKPQVMSQTDNGLANRRAFSVSCDLSDEGTIDFYFVDREILQIA